MDNKDLERIIKYNMTPEEAKAYKLTIIYRKTAEKVFPDYHHYKVGKGDPRKSTLFKYCYKLIRETEDKLKYSEYRLYIKAQLDVMKAITQNDEYTLINPNCLTGKKAWARGCVWKKHYDAKVKTNRSANPLK